MAYKQSIRLTDQDIDDIAVIWMAMTDMQNGCAGPSITEVIRTALRVLAGAIRERNGQAKEDKS